VIICPVLTALSAFRPMLPLESRTRRCGAQIITRYGSSQSATGAFQCDCSTIGAGAALHTNETPVRMNVRPNPRYAEFVYRIGKISPNPAPWKGVTFRSVELEHAAPKHILSGEGSYKFGGRWNAPETFPVIYSSTRPGTAIEEAFQLAADYELTPEDLKPRVTCGIQWDLSRVLDLTAANLPTWLNLAKWMLEDFSHINDGGFETLCQALGRAARNSGASAILCPSARVAGGVNLVVFPDRVRRDESMQLLGEDELQKYLA
jgi:RES domain-containing protein